MTDASRRLLAWFFDRYPRGDDGSPDYALAVRRAQEILLDAREVRRRTERVEISRHLGWRTLPQAPGRPARYVPALSGKCYRGPKAGRAA